ncbi:MAG TPA: NUDIX hydrolase, partial [Flavisolibacter sp.]|nr:NUDIX hydrolase [Flavisolibacter sp.]
MQQTIYFGNKPLFLTDTITPDLEAYLHQRETMFIDEWNIHTVKTMIHEMNKEEVDRGIFLHTDVPELMDSFQQRFTVILAGGGLVLSPAKSILLIFRRGKWDLPKGKLDEGEDLETC